MKYAVIVTNFTQYADQAGTEHQEKLNNFASTGYSKTDAELAKFTAPYRVDVPKKTYGVPSIAFGMHGTFPSYVSIVCYEEYTVEELQQMGYVFPATKG